MNIVSFLFVLFVVEYAKCIISNEVKKKLNEALCKTECLDEISTNCSITTCNCNMTNTFDNIDESHIKQIPESLELVCMQEDIITMKWEGIPPAIYFLEWINDKLQIIIQDPIYCNKHTLANLRESKFYRIRLWGVTKSKTVFTTSTSLDVTTHSSHVPPLAVPMLKMKELELKGSSYSAHLTWTPASDRSCYYYVMWFHDEDLGAYKEIEIDNPWGTFEYVIDNLDLDSAYTVQVNAMSSGHLESEKQVFHFKTPNCIHAFKSLQHCSPEMPKNLMVEENPVSKDKSRNNFNYDIVIKWDKPEYVPDYYVAEIITMLNVSEQYVKNISGLQTSVIFNNVEVGVHYQVHLKAVSPGGESKAASLYRHIKGPHLALLTPDSSSISSEKLTLIIFGSLCGLFAAIGVLFLINVKLLKCIKKRKRMDYFQEIKDRSMASLEISMVEKQQQEEMDEWEIDPNKLYVETVLGEGAFGVVRQGWLETAEDRKLRVAIKMLKDDPSGDELRQFKQEIDILKCVGTHPHLVSLIGCVSNNHLNGPMLVVEFCSKGDLLTYLRKSWEKLSAFRDSNITYVNDVDVNGDPTASNRLYDIDLSALSLEDCIMDPTEMVSFARQISLGMEYLSSLKVLHRDLAARNILLCEDKTVKVSDFGLSRDVYAENVYWKLTAGKLPLKWMALESLTHQVYTTQSDVWSFGVLLWEIVTLGCNPYPGILPSELLHLLKRGYRMGRPSNCSEEIYSIMVDCWKANPKDRPTFTTLRFTFDKLLENASEYLRLDNIVFHDDFFNTDRTSEDESHTGTHSYIKPINFSTESTKI